MHFTFTTAGESHGRALIATIEGLPAGLPISLDFINHELWRRQQGYGRGGRMKIETDQVQILTGVRHGETLGGPIALMVENRDAGNWGEVMSVTKPEAPLERDRKVIRPRPGHADLVGGMKYDRRDLRDILERASARETTMRVAVGAMAKQLLAEFGIQLASHVIQLGEISSAASEATFELNGVGLGGFPTGLTISAGNSLIRNLVINRFGFDGLNLTNNGGNTIEGCFIGTNAAGAMALGNGLRGIIIDTPNNVIGGTTAAARNLISGNGSNGILIGGVITGNRIEGNANVGVALFSLASNNQIQGNYIGTDVNGTADLGNVTDGVALTDASGNTIGGALAGEGNRIAFNDGNGIDVLALRSATPSSATKSLPTAASALISTTTA